jgi:hypothetical protein
MTLILGASATKPRPAAQPCFYLLSLARGQSVDFKVPDTRDGRKINVSGDIASAVRRRYTTYTPTLIERGPTGSSSGNAQEITFESRTRVIRPRYQDYVTSTPQPTANRGIGDEEDA